MNYTDYNTWLGTEIKWTPPYWNPYSDYSYETLPVSFEPISENNKISLQSIIDKIQVMAMIEKNGLYKSLSKVNLDLLLKILNDKS